MLTRQQLGSIHRFLMVVGLRNTLVQFIQHFVEIGGDFIKGALHRGVAGIIKLA